MPSSPFLDSTSSSGGDDSALLNSLGYKQEFKRILHTFDSFEKSPFTNDKNKNDERTNEE
jgi:hypothetical protein